MSINQGRLAVLVAALALTAAAGCTAAGQAPSAGGGSAPARSTGPAVAADPGVTDYLAYVGGTAGKADTRLTPITLGWVNTQGGAFDFKEKTAAAQAAVKYVNTELGGIGGHPLALHTCFIAQAEEEGQKCGQQMRNDKSISTVVLGAIAFGNQSLAAVLGNAVPRVVDFSADANASAKNMYILFGDSTHTYGAYAAYVSGVMHAKTAAIVYADFPANREAATDMTDQLDRAGTATKLVGYNPQTADVLGPLVAAGAQNADVIIPITDPTGCGNVAKALRQTGSVTTVVTNPLCIDSRVESAAGGDLPKGWIFGVPGAIPTDRTAPDSRAFVAAATRNGLSVDDAARPLAALSWGEMLAVVKVMNAVGADNISPQAMSGALQAFTGPVPMGPSALHCGEYADAPALCTNQSRFYRYNGNDEFELVTDWLADTP